MDTHEPSAKHIRIWDICSAWAIFVIATAALWLSGCVSPAVQEGAVTAELPPIERQARDTGDEWHALKDGERIAFTIIAVDRGTLSLKSSEGCSWKQHSDRFAPAIEWKDCAPYSDGAQTVTHVDEAYPLTIGKKWSYRTRGSNAEGHSWNSVRNCEVEGTARIETVLGVHDTYKVVCNGGRTKRVWYVSPEHEDPVLFVRTRRGATTRYELVEMKSS